MNINDVVPTTPIDIDLYGPEASTLGPTLVGLARRFFLKPHIFKITIYLIYIKKKIKMRMEMSDFTKIHNFKRKKKERKSTF